MMTYGQKAPYHYHFSTKSKYFQFANLVGLLGCNHLTIYGLFDASKYDWGKDRYSFYDDWYEDLMLGIKEILKNDDDYARVGWIQIGKGQRSLLLPLKEKLQKYIMQEMTVQAGHSQEKCTLIMIDLQKIRYEK